MNKNDVLLRNATTNRSQVTSLRKIVFTKFNAACGVRVRRVAACGCKMRFSTFLCFKKFCIRHVIYQNSAFFKLYTMVSVSALIGSKKCVQKLCCWVCMKSLGKMVVIAQGIFDLRVLYQEKIRFEKCAQKVGILKFFFHKLVSYVPNIISYQLVQNSLQFGDWWL